MYKYFVIVYDYIYIYIHIYVCVGVGMCMYYVKLVSIYIYIHVCPYIPNTYIKIYIKDCCQVLGYSMFLSFICTCYCWCVSKIDYSKSFYPNGMPEISYQRHIYIYIYV